MNHKIPSESPLIRLPGRLYRKQAGWWWDVQLPGEKSPRDRALKPEGSRRATADRRLAEEIAFHLWQEAVRAEAIAQTRAQETTRMQRLRLQFREKMKALSDVVTSAEARAEAETAARAKLEVKLNALRNQLSQMAPCECCGRSVPESELQPIDSGQCLCRSCMDNLRRAVQRQSFQEHRAEDDTSRTKDRRPIATDRDSRRETSSVLRSASPNEFEDLLTGRNTHGSDVLYAKAGRR